MIFVILVDETVARQAYCGEQVVQRAGRRAELPALVKNPEGVVGPVAGFYSKKALAKRMQHAGLYLEQRTRLWACFIEKAEEGQF